MRGRIQALGRQLAAPHWQIVYNDSFVFPAAKRLSLNPIGLQLQNPGLGRVWAEDVLLRNVFKTCVNDGEMIQKAKR